IKMKRSANLQLITLNGTTAAFFDAALNAISVDAGAGRDTIFARNGRADTIHGGAGNDSAVADANDAIFDIERNVTGTVVYGIVFDDANGNGTKNTGELGFADAIVYLDTNQNGLLDNGETTSLTDGNGFYFFGNL